MRSALAHLLAVLVLVSIALGPPHAAQAACVPCGDCTLTLPAEGKAPCPQDTRACQTGQTCAGQLQKMTARAALGSAQGPCGGCFGETAAAAVKLAHLTPETAPPRL